MRKLLVTLGFLLLALAVSAPARAQVRIQVVLPSVLPRLVVVQPGVQVFEDWDEEIFFSGGFYWVRRDDRWYRSRDHRGQWRYVEERRVPVTIGRITPGNYRHWRGPEHRERRVEVEHRRERGHEAYDAQRREGPPGQVKKGRGGDRGEGRGEKRGEGHGEGGR